MRHTVTETGLHTIIDSKGHVHVYTENEYNHQSWWYKIKLKYNL